MGTVAHLIVGLALSLASTAWGEEPVIGDIAPAVDEQCLFNGWKPGMSVTKSTKYVVKARPSVVEAKGVISYEAGSKPGLFRQYIFVKGGVVSAVVREYAGDQVALVFAALEKRYGDPKAAPLMPTVKSGYSPFHAKVRLETQAYWDDPRCGYDLQFTKQNQMTMTGLGGGSTDRGALLITPTTETPEGDSTLLR